MNKIAQRKKLSKVGYAKLRKDRVPSLKRGYKIVSKSEDAPVANMLTRVQISKAVKRKGEGGIVVLRAAKKGDTNTTRVLMSSGKGIASQIATTNGRLLNLHKNGKIDLSGDSF